MAQPRKWPIYHLLFENQYQITSTFMRFQEYYESPKFADKIFSWEEFMDWYAGKYGNFTYLQDRSGFNIPREILTPFYRGEFNPLTKKEKLFLRRFKNVRGAFYIIGTIQNKEGYLEHELVHGLYYIDIIYRIKVQEALRMFDTYPIRRALMNLGYGKSTLRDEINAYAITGWTKKLKKYKSKIMEVTLKQTFFKHFGLRIDDKKDIKKLLSKIHHWKFRIK